MRLLIFICLATVTMPAFSKVFKCIGKYGQATYQNSPCADSTKEQQLDIKFDPEKEAEAKAKLEAIRSEYEAKKASKLEQEKQKAAQYKEAVSLEFARRSAIAQQEQAQAQQRQAEALERQNQNINRPIYYLPAIPTPKPTIPPPDSTRPEGQEPTPSQ